MNKELVPILADAIREYYADDELRELCELFDSELERSHEDSKPAYFRFAKRLICQIEQANNYRTLAALVPSLLVRCSEMLSKTSWERRDHHQEMSARLDRLRGLLDNMKTTSEVAVPDNHPFTAKSEIRELVAKAEGEVFLVDPYVGITTLDCLREVQHPIRILTGQQKQSVEQGFESAVKEFCSEGRVVAVRRHTKLHDRYLIFNKRCWLVGSSMKDAGKKALNMIECLDTKLVIVCDAEKKWSEATVL